MHPHSRQFDHRPFNDYVLSPTAPAYKLISSPEKNLSSNSLYYHQNALSRKKLTVISRDSSRQNLRGDYMMAENSNGFTSRGSAAFSPMRNNDTSNTLTHRNSQASDSLNNSRVYKSKLKRPISPSPALMTPTKALKLKKSMLSDNHPDSASQMSEQRSINQSASRPKFQSSVTSPIKIQVQGHKRFGSSANEGQVLYGTQNFHEKNLQTLKRELTSILNARVMEFQGKLIQQEDTIRVLESKLIENSKKLKQKDSMIDQLNRVQRSKTQYVNSYEASKQKNVTKNIENYEDSYILKRVNEIQTKFNLILTQNGRIQKTQQSLNKKLGVIQCQLIKMNSSALNQLKLNLSKFLEQKLTQVSTLSESISYLDNKLIGRTQAIKETLCEIKQKIKEAEDSWTQKDTKGTKDSTTIGTSKQDEFPSSQNKNSSVRRIQNKLREVTSFDDIKDSPYKNLQCSLEFSLTSYDEETNRSLNHQNKHLKNVYFEQNINEMEDVSIGLFGEGQKNDVSRLTDDFYYPGSGSNHEKLSPRNLSPIHPKKQSQKNIGSLKLSNEAKRINLIKKQSPMGAKTPVNAFKAALGQQSPSSQRQIRISNQQITKKMEMIQELIENKKATTSESIEKGQLRCYVDKTGYLKYTDSKTFVFDRKGNLIPCTDGEFWFLVTKGLIYGSKDEEESRTMSFIEYND